MSKRIWYLFLAVVVIVIGGFLVYNNVDNVKDRLVWNHLKGQLTAENVTMIEFGGAGAKPLVIAEADRPEVLKLVREASFDKSNRQDFGPSPGARLTITFKDGKRVSLGMWSFESYELQTEQGSQFLIKAAPLGVWLRNHFQTPSIG